MGAQVTTLKRNVATASCCGSVTDTEQKELETEVSHQISHQTHQQSNADADYRRLRSIPEDNKIEDNQLTEISNEFNEWIEENKLDDIKHIFIKHKMTTIPISNQSESYRHFISDHELMMHYTNSMQIATKAIAALNTKTQYKTSSPSYDDEYKTDTNTRYRAESAGTILRQNSVQLCDDSFAAFVDKHAEKVINKLWDPKIDAEHRGYIESENEIANAIGFIAVLHKGKLYRKNPEHEQPPNNEYIQKEADLIAQWVCKSYGEIEDGKYKHRVTKNDFLAELPNWITEYAETKGFD